MRIALMFPHSEQGKRTTSFLKNEVAGSHVRYARAVIAYASDLTGRVLSGAISLNDAYQALQLRLPPMEDVSFANGRNRNDCSEITLLMKCPPLEDMIKVRIFHCQTTKDRQDHWFVHLDK